MREVARRKHGKDSTRLLHHSTQSTSKTAKRTMQSTLAQAESSMKSRGETCRQLRLRQQIGIETIGRRAVGIPSILHGLTIREIFLRVRTSPDNRRGCCKQNTPMYRWAQCVTKHTEQNDHISSREHAWLKIAHLCLKKVVIHVSCLVPFRT